ncbi:MAG TPA: hypothetical protein VJ085_05505 [Candidatus Acidoferrales bacterium]|nr:hypothetical protein [Candidatus Acidoferrales bacterium]
MKTRTLLVVSVLMWLAVTGAGVAQPVGTAQVLDKPELNKLLPDAIFLDGEKCPVQKRNAVGARMEDGKLVLVTLVDTSAFSSAFEEKYVGAVLAQGKLVIGKKTLTPGTYGLGKKMEMEEGEESVTFVVYDLGGTALAEVVARKDEALRPVTPIQLKAEAGAPLRLYLGAYYVLLSSK